MSTELQLPPQQNGMDLIRAALQSDGTPSEKAALVKELVNLQQSMVRFEWEREERQYRIDFDSALNRCQSAVGRITPNQKRNDTNSWWADYSQLDRALRPIWSGEGFSIAFSEVAPLSPGKVRIRAELSRMGVSKEYFSEITPSTTGPKGNAMATATDADAIALARAKRYILLSIFNIAVGIDKIEKDGIPDDELKAAIAGIQDATTLDEAKGAFRGPWKRAVEAGDTATKDRLSKAYEDHKRKLSGVAE